MEISVRELSMRIKGRLIFADLNFDIPSGASVAIIGASGCGKTTLLTVIGGLLPASSGTLLLGGENATKWSQRRIRKFWQEHAAFILQDAGLDDDENVAYNVTLEKTLFGSVKITPRTREILAQVGLDARAQDPVQQLSGGERRRVAIARAIYKEADIIYADEPTASLDAANRQLVQDLLLEQAERGATVLIATHDVELANACSHKIQLGITKVSAR